MKSFLFRSSLCTLPFLLFAAIGVIMGGCPFTPPGETDTNSESSSSTGGESTGLTMTTATLTSTTTAATTTVSTSTTGMMTASTSDATMTDPTTDDTSTATTEGPACDKNLICDGMEDITTCLHDCGACTPDGMCDPATETPYKCPEDCNQTTCNGDAKIDALSEQCDDGNQEDNDGCTNECKVNVCGDGFVYEGGGEECDDGNDDETDGCLSSCLHDRRLVFVTSGTVTGNMGGLVGADDFCGKLVPEGTGTFKAWLSDGNAGPSSRFGYSPAFTGLFVLSDGTVVAEGWTDMLDGALAHAVDLDEKKAAVNSAAVWTNTGTNGSPKGTAHCTGWTVASVSVKGHYGGTEQPDATWTDIDLQPCGSAAHLYCVQVSAP